MRYRSCFGLYSEKKMNHGSAAPLELRQPSSGKFTKDCRPLRNTARQRAEVLQKGGGSPSMRVVEARITGLLLTVRVYRWERYSGLYLASRMFAPSGAPLELRQPSSRKFTKTPAAAPYSDEEVKGSKGVWGYGSVGVMNSFLPHPHTPTLS